MLKEGYIVHYGKRGHIRLLVMYSVINILKQENVFANVQVGGKKDVLNLMISSFRDEVSEMEFRAIKEAVHQREKMMSTGIGCGLAIPHGKSNKIKTNCAAFATLTPPIAYNALDNEPVSIVFLFAGRDTEHRSHAKTLGSIARLLNDDIFKKKAMIQQTGEELYFLLKEHARIKSML